MKNIYLIIVMIICFTTSLSNIGYAADLTIKVRDSKTGETIYEDEKTYTPEEREQANQRTQAGEIYTYTDKDGITIITDRPIPERSKATVTRIDSNNEITPSDTRSELNAKIEALINRLENDPKNRVTQNMGLQINPLTGKREELIKTGGLKKHILEQIVELRKAQLRNQGNPQDVVKNQQDDMEDSMKRQQSEMEDKMRQQKARMNAQRIQQQAEINKLQHDQRMQEMNKAFEK